MNSELMANSPQNEDLSDERLESEMVDIEKSIVLMLMRSGWLAEIIRSALAGFRGVRRTSALFVGKI